jgi:hypothetical protein
MAISIAELTRNLGIAPRRNLVRAILGGGVGVLAAAATRPAPTNAKRKKKKCPVCPPSPICPASCLFRFNEVSGKTICGIASSVKQSPCAPCTSSADCANVETFVHCVNAVTNISTGQTVGLGVCQTTPTVGFFCANVSACLT